MLGPRSAASFVTSFGAAGVGSGWGSCELGRWNATRSNIEEVTRGEVINMVEERTKAVVKVSISVSKRIHTD